MFDFINLAIKAWTYLSPSVRLAWGCWFIILPFSFVGFLLGLRKFENWRIEEANKAEKTREVPDSLASLPIKKIFIEAFTHSPKTFKYIIKATAILAVLFIIVSLWDVTLFRDIRLQAGKYDAPLVSTNKGFDEIGKSATYKVILLSGEYFWKLGSTDTVINYEGTEIEFKKKLNSNGIQYFLKKSTDIIAIGVASCLGRPSEEDNRSYYRAVNLIGWIRDLQLDKSLDQLYLLNLGQYTEPCRSYDIREPEQRMVMIVSVTEKEDGVDIRESFRDVLRKLKVLQRIRIFKYSNWPKDRFELEPRLYYQ